MVGGRGLDSITYTHEDCLIVDAGVRSRDPAVIARHILRDFNILFGDPICVSLEVEYEPDENTARSFTLSPDCPERCD